MTPDAHFDMENGEYRRAAKDLAAAIERDAGYFDHVLPLLKAECHLHCGELDEAEAECAKVPDGFVYPSFRGALDAGKEHILFDLRQARRRRSGEG
jgi:hypothetical protein